MIEIQNQVFALHNAAGSYLFRVSRQGALEHLHFGRRVSIDDAEALSCKAGLGWGGGLVYGDGTLAECQDTMALEWSGTGRGDFRETPAELGGLELPAAFCYEGHARFSGPVPMETSLPQARGEAETLAVFLRNGDLKLTLYYTVWEEAITRRVLLENQGQRQLTLDKLMSSCVDLLGSFRLTSFHGGWISEMRREQTPVGSSRLCLGSTTGFSSHRCNPGFLLSEPDATEDSGLVYGFNLVYSGSFYSSCQRSAQGLTRVMQGIAPERFTLESGGRFETPEAVMTCSERGFGGVSAQMHRFVSRHIVPEWWQSRPRPILYNSWEGCGFRFTQRSLLAQARRARELGCELFVLDDGWFGARDSDTAGLGDYSVNRKKLPDGLEGLSRQVRKLGMEFGLWFEPEAVNPNSDLYRAHPDWALGDPKLLGRNELLLDLRRREVRDYIVESVSGILDRANISYVKWDMNRHSGAPKSHDYILGLYEVLHRIFDPRPEILLEGCSSGGNRFDLGMLCFAPQIWCSDNTDPIERLEIQKSLSYLYPQSTMGAHVSAAPHAQTLRTTPLSTRGNLAFFGILGYELDLKTLLPVEEAEIRDQIAFYKQYRSMFQFGELRRLTEEGAEGFQASEDGTTLVGLFHRLQAAAPPYERLRVYGLKEDSRYRFHARPQRLRIGGFGGLIRHVTPVSLNPNGVVLRVVDHHKAMMDDAQCGAATGGALRAGIGLSARFAGTGYAEFVRMQGDFGSSVYVIEEEKKRES